VLVVTLARSLLQSRPFAASGHNSRESWRRPLLVPCSSFGLIVAKLDRLARNTGFLLTVTERWSGSLLAMPGR
jgi:hypothetical protein